MKTYIVYEVVTNAYAYSVNANSKEEAKDKLEMAGFSDNGDDILRDDSYDKEISREAMCRD